MGESLPENNRINDNAEHDWRAVYELCQGGLRAFLRGRLNQEADVDDCLQMVFVKMTQQARRDDSDVEPVARRAWLFRVASNEAALIWRNKATSNRVIENKGRQSATDDDILPDTTDKVILTETTVKLRQAIEKLPDHYREVVQMRIDQDKTFQTIADELSIPLGTALTRMRRALEKLRQEFEPEIDPTIETE
tara:strand:+ start:53357 stop:53935 length:579 start_codon:yes stop_codon:yes gene_type:complete